jgi:hypothetical protein
VQNGEVNLLCLGCRPSGIIREGSFKMAYALIVLPCGTLDGNGRIEALTEAFMVAADMGGYKSMHIILQLLQRME